MELFFVVITYLTLQNEQGGQGLDRSYYIEANDYCEAENRAKVLATSLKAGEFQIQEINIQTIPFLPKR